MDVDSLVAQWRLYAKTNKVRADLLRKDGDSFGMDLCIARGEVRGLAAELLQRSTNYLDAAAIMHQKARELWQHNLPLIGFDSAAIQYTRCRTWQDCALALDPSLPIVQPKLAAS
ncbi:MAG TPA: hypothetical protein VHX38_38540 [Pseudonocardiaceae bacterium]|jgi:hypothetical protein|nr:hypothetical protein [Pseudonocardiaceae bacterium]